MKKKILLFILIVLSFFCNTLKVYANDNVTVETKKENDIINISYNVGNDQIYGLYTEIEFDSNGFQFDNCDGSGYTVSSSQKDNSLVVIVESLTPIKNEKIVTCKFKQLSDNSNITIKKLDTSDSKILKRQSSVTTQFVTTKNTFANINIVSLLIALILISLGTYIIIRTKKGKALLLLILIIPFSVYAADAYTDKDLSDLRDILLNKVKYDDSNKKYDLDEDKELTINDLILLKREVNKPKISISTATKGESQYYTEAISNVTVDSDYESKVYYCVDSKDCTPTTEYKKDGKVSIKLGDSATAQKVCIKAVNSVGFSTTKCDSKTYLVDSKTPTLTLKNNSVTYTILTTNDNVYNTKANTNTPTYGVGGGSLSCTNANNTSASQTITCTATGNNGLKATKTYTLVINHKTLKVLFVGNSKTYKNDIPAKFESIAESNGYRIETTSVTEGGKTLQWLYENKTSELNAVSDYDYLILQEQVDALTASDPTDYKNGARNVKNLVKVKNPNIQVYVRSLWTTAVQEGNNYYFDSTGFNNASNNSTTVGNYISATVIHDGAAFKNIDTNHHSIILFTDEKGHQSVEGAYLSAACIYKNVLNKSPVGTTYKAGLSDNVANTLLSVANSVG